MPSARPRLLGDSKDQADPGEILLMSVDEGETFIELVATNGDEGEA
jgi:hypothetical protein